MVKKKKIEIHHVVQYMGETQWMKQEGIKKQIFWVIKEETRYELVYIAYSPRYKLRV